MKNSSLLLLMILFSCASLFAQKTVHDANAQPRKVHGYHAIEIGGGVDLYLSQGNEEAVAVSATTEAYRDMIRVEVVDGVLKIGLEPGSGWKMNWGNRKMKAYVSAKELDGIKAGGGSDVYVDNEIHSNNLQLRFSGGSDFRGKVNTGQLSLHVSGGSDAYISGQTEKAHIIASGGSDIHAYDLNTNFSTIESSGGSDIHITANKEIHVTASGGSDVYYKGNASLVSNKGGGSGVKRVN